MIDAAAITRNRLAANGRNPENKNAGIRTGSDLHLAEMLLKERDDLLALVQRFAAALSFDEVLQGGERVGLTERSRIDGLALNAALIDAKAVRAPSSLDLAWAQINALGGVPANAIEEAQCETINQCLDIIERLGARRA